MTDRQRLDLQILLRALRDALGTWHSVSKALGMPYDTIRGIARGIDFGSTKILSRAMVLSEIHHVPVPETLSATNDNAPRCPTCGAVLSSDSLRKPS